MRGQTCRRVDRKCDGHTRTYTGKFIFCLCIALDRRLTSSQLTENCIFIMKNTVNLVLHFVTQLQVISNVSFIWAANIIISYLFYHCCYYYYVVNKDFHISDWLILILIFDCTNTFNIWILLLLQPKIHFWKCRPMWIIIPPKIKHFNYEKRWNLVKENALMWRDEMATDNVVMHSWRHPHPRVRLQTTFTLFNQRPCQSSTLRLQLQGPWLRGYDLLQTSIICAYNSTD